MGIVINGDPRQNSGWFAGHLTNEENNERITKFEAHNTVATDVHGFFEELNFIAKRMNPDPWDFFYHANINTESDERLTDKQWDHAILRLGQGLKDKKGRSLADQPYIVHEHEKKGRIHRHIIWSRMHYDKDTGKFSVIDIQFNYYKHLDIARELEREFGLRINIDPRKNPKRERALANWEFFRGQKSGIDPRQVKNETTEVFNQSLNGGDFIRSMEYLRYVVAKGDRRDYVIIDIAGDVHSLAKRVKGGNASIIREKMKDVDRDKLPSVEEGKEIQERNRVKYDALNDEHKKQKREQIREELEKEAEEAAKSITEKQEQVAQSITQEQERQQQEIQKEEQRKEAAGKTEEERKEGVLKQQAEEHKKDQQYHEQQVELYKQAEQVEANLKAIAAEHLRRFEEAREQAKWLHEHRDVAQSEAHERYNRNLPQHYNPNNHFGYLIDASNNEHKAYARERDALENKINLAQNPIEREKFTLQRDILRADYRALREERLGKTSELVRGRMATKSWENMTLDELKTTKDKLDPHGNPYPDYKTMEAELHFKQSSIYKDEAKQKRDQYREMVAKEKAQQEKDKQEKEEQPQTKKPEQEPKNEHKQEERKEKNIMVEYRSPTGGPPAERETLKSYCHKIDGIPKSDIPSVEKINKRQRTSALLSIKRDLRDGKPLNKLDLDDLSREDIKAIRKNGEQHINQIIKDHEQEQKREHEQPKQQEHSFDHSR